MSIINRIYGDIDRLLTGTIEAESVDANELTLGGVTRTSWPSGGASQFRYVAPSISGEYSNVFDTIQGAIDDGVSAGERGTVVILESVAETGVSAPAGVRIIGRTGVTHDGAGAIQVDTSGGDGIKIGRGCTVENLYITGDGTSYGLQLTQDNTARNIRVSNVTVDGCATGFRYVGKHQEASYRDVYAINCGTGHLIEMSGSARYFNGNRFYGIVAKSCDEGIVVEPGARNDVQMAGNSFHGIRCETITNSPLTVDVDLFADNFFEGYAFESTGAVPSVTAPNADSIENVWHGRADSGNPWTLDASKWAVVTGRFTSTA